MTEIAYATLGSSILIPFWCFALVVMWAFTVGLLVGRK